MNTEPQRYRETDRRTLTCRYYTALCEASLGNYGTADNQKQRKRWKTLLSITVYSSFAYYTNDIQLVFWQHFGWRLHSRSWALAPVLLFDESIIAKFIHTGVTYGVINLLSERIIAETSSYFVTATPTNVAHVYTLMSDAMQLSSMNEKLFFKLSIQYFTSYYRNIILECIKLAELFKNQSTVTKVIIKIEVALRLLHLCST